MSHPCGYYWDVLILRIAVDNLSTIVIYNVYGRIEDADFHRVVNKHVQIIWVVVVDDYCYHYYCSYILNDAVDDDGVSILQTYWYKSHHEQIIH